MKNQLQQKGLIYVVTKDSLVKFTKTARKKKTWKSQMTEINQF